MLLMTSTAMRTCTSHNVIHYALQFAMHQWVLWWMRLKWVGVKAVWLIGCGVELSVEEARRQHWINRAITGSISTVTSISVMILIKVLISTIRTSQIRCVWCQQIILHRWFGLWWVAQASWAILTSVQVVVVCSAVVVSQQIIRRSIGERSMIVVTAAVVVVVRCNISTVHERLMAHLSLCWRRSNEAGQVLVEICCCRVRQHYRRLNLVEKLHMCVACFNTHLERSHVCQQSPARFQWASTKSPKLDYWTAPLSVLCMCRWDFHLSSMADMLRLNCSSSGPCWRNSSRTATCLLKWWRRKKIIAYIISYKWERCTMHLQGDVGRNFYFCKTRDLKLN